MERDLAMFCGGLGLAVLAAVLMLLGGNPISAPITVLVVGIVLLAVSRRRGDDDRDQRMPW